MWCGILMQAEALVLAVAPCDTFTVQYSRVQYNTVQYSTVQYSTVQYSAIQYSTVHCNAADHSSSQLSNVCICRTYSSTL